MKNLKFSALLALVLITSIGSLRAQHYIIREIAPPGGVGFSFAWAINNRGQVTGDYYTISANGEFSEGSAFTYFNGHLQSLGTLGTFANEDNISIGRAINDHGQVAGQSVAGPWTPIFQDEVHPFLYTGGHMIDLKVRGSGNGINNLGYVVGTAASFVSGHFVDQAFVSYGGSPVRYLPGLSGNSSAYAINDLNQILGADQKGSFIWYGGKVLYLSDVYKRQFVSDYTSVDARALNRLGHVTGDMPVPAKDDPTVPAPATVAFIYSNGTLKFLTTDMVNSSGGMALNSFDQVVGYGGPNFSAVLFLRGQVIDLNSRLVNNTTGLVIDAVYGINDAGQIVGYGHEPSGPSRAILLTPDSPNPY